MNKVLIDAGKSSRGWSRIGNYFKCPQLFAYQYRLSQKPVEEGGAPDLSPPISALTRGSLGHTLQAHQHAIWGARLPEGVVVDTMVYKDPDIFMDPETAAHAWCDKNGGHEHLEQMIGIFRRYVSRFPEPPGDVIAVEAPVTAVIGVKAGAWGLWVGEERGGGWYALDGAEIDVTPLAAPGHPDHGTAITITRRIDLVTRDRAGRYYIWDHKHQANVNANSSATGYAIDGGFAAFRIMGQQLYGERFGGVWLNLIQTMSPYRVARVAVPATPHRDAQFARQLWMAEHAIAQLDLTTDHWEWPKAQNELSCYGRYGACSALNLCAAGPGAALLE